MEGSVWGEQISVGESVGFEAGNLREGGWGVGAGLRTTALNGAIQEVESHG